MERPQAEWLIEFLEKAGKLKSVPRHCITPEGVRETVADGGNLRRCDDERPIRTGDGIFKPLLDACGTV